MNISDQIYLEIVKRLVSDNRTVRNGTNLQNIPSKGDGELVRKCFIPPKDHLFIGADLSSIEPRITAHILWTKYGDNSMREPYLQGLCPYVEVAMIIFGKLYPELEREHCLDKSWFDPVSRTGGTVITKHLAPKTAFQPRKLAKQGQLAVSYGQSEKGFAESMGVPIEIGAFFIETFNELYPKFKEMVMDIREHMREKGFSQTLWGRKRRFPMYNYYKKLADENESKLTKLYIERKKLMNKNRNPTAAQKKRFNEIQNKIQELSEPRGKVMAMERQCFNSVIQGSGSDILKMNGNRMARICREKGWKMVASIHDELIIAVPKKDVTPETIELVEDVMCNTVAMVSDFEFTVPLKTDIVIMPRWMEEYSPEEWDFEKCCPKS